MKKIISLLLSITLLIGCFSVVSASERIVEITDTDEALALLTYMGMTGDNEDLSANITRAEFSSLVAKAVKATASSGKQYYADVDSTFWAFDAVSALTELGYLSAGSNMLFRPNDNIMLSEASKIIVSMLGYGELANAKGGFPTGYLTVANTLDIIQGITNQYITREQAYVMLMRAMNVPLFVANAVSDDGISYEVDKNSTILSVYHDIYYIEDTVNAVGQISLKNSAKLSEGKVLIGDKTLSAEKISADMYDYIGMTIIGYYTETDEKNASLIVALPLGEENSVVTVSKNNVSTIEDNGGYYGFEYYDENEKLKSVKVPRGAVVIKNGESVTEDLFNEIRIAKGSYKFLDHNNDGKIDVLFVNEYYNLVVGLIENLQAMSLIKDIIDTEYYEYYRGHVGSKQVIYDKFDQTRKIDVTEDNDKIIKFKNFDGSLSSIDDISVNDVLNVYRSKDGNYIEVISGKGTVKGTVSEISYPDNNKALLTINEEEYTMDKEVIDLLEFNLDAGTAGTFYLDSFGEIGFAKEDANADIIYGYLVAVDKADKGLNSDIRVQIFGKNNVFDTYKWSEKTTIDGDYIDNRDKAYEFLGKHTKQVIRFAADENKVLTFLDTLDRNVAKEGENNLIESLKLGSYVYSGGSNSFAESSSNPIDKVVLQSTTPILVVPTDATIDKGDYDAESFLIKQRSNLTLDVTYNNVATYRVKPDEGFEDIILMKKDGLWSSITSYTPYMIVDIKSTVDEEGKVVDLVTVQSGAKPKQFMTADSKVLEGYNIKRGDLVWFEFNQDATKFVSVIDVLVDSDTLKPTYANVNNEPGYYAKRQKEIASLTTADKERGYKELVSHKGSAAVIDDSGRRLARFMMLYGYADVIDSNSIMRFAYTKEDCENRNYTMIRSIANAKVVVYDRNAGKNGNIYWAPASDIIGYRTDSENCSFVAAAMWQNVSDVLFVYK